MIVRKVVAGICLVGLGMLVGCVSDDQFRQAYLRANIDTFTISGRSADGQSETVLVHSYFGGFEVSNDDLTITYSDREMAPQARELLSWLTEAHQSAADEAGFSYPGKITWTLTEVPDFPRSVKFKFDAHNDRVNFPLCYSDPNAPAGKILADNLRWGLVKAMYHELAECSLISPNMDPVVMPDLDARASVGLISYPIRIDHRTRWFRDGWANYVAWVFEESLYTKVPGHHVAPVLDYLPFKHLASEGRKLKGWTQFNSDDGRLYSAALGVFLDCRERHGDRAVATIIRECNRYTWLDGGDLETIWFRCCNENPHEIAKAFRWPTTGVWVDFDGNGPYIDDVDPDTPAADAQLAEGDRIVSIAGREVRSWTGWQMAMYRGGWSRGKAVEVVFRRGESLRKVMLTPRDDD